MCNLIPRLVLIVALLPSAARSALYNVRELKPLPGYTGAWAAAINDAGQIAGTCARKNPDGSISYDAVVWQNADGIPVSINPFPGKSSYSIDINDLGEVLGQGVQPFVYTAPRTRFFGPHYSDDAYVQFLSIKNSHRVFGRYWTDEVVWDPPYLDAAPAVPSLPYGNIADINDSGVAAATVSHEGVDHAVRIDPDGHVTDLNPPGDHYSYSAAINNLGQVAGSIDRRPALWDGHTFYVLPGEFYDWPLQINDLGQIIGGYDVPRLWLPHAFYDVNDVIPPHPDYRLTAATSINNSGLILANAKGTPGYDDRAFVLTPVPEPVIIGASILFLFSNRCPRRTSVRH